MPSFNQGRYIGEAIDSVFRQGVDSLELIVMDGGSTDETLEVLRSFDRDPRLRWQSSIDNGLYDALNTAIEISQGEWIGWLNTDDLYPPNTLKQVADLTDDDSVDIIAGDAELFVDRAEQGRRTIKHWRHYRGDQLAATPANLQIAHLNACFLRRSLLDLAGRFDTRYRVCSDRDYLLRLVRIAPKLRHIDAVACQYRAHPDSLTMSGYFSTDDAATGMPSTSTGWADLRTICREHLADARTPPAARDWCRRILRGITSRESAEALLRNDWTGMARSASLGLRTGPAWSLSFGRSITRLVLHRFSDPSR